jgi:uncharacterized protein
MSKPVLFIHGAGEGAYDADRLLAESLQSALGSEYEVQCPHMPDEKSSPYDLWKAEIGRRLAALNVEVVLVGHSVGGSVLLKYLCEARSAHSIAGLFVIAASFWGADPDWHWDEMTLPADAAARLSGTWPIFLYHSRDDEFVPFAHLALYAAKLPRATVRAFDGRGHQFGNDLTHVANDIKLTTK